jgi:hypothetical protein
MGLGRHLAGAFGDLGEPLNQGSGSTRGSSSLDGQGAASVADYGVGPAGDPHGDVSQLSVDPSHLAELVVVAATPVGVDRPGPAAHLRL